MRVREAKLPDASNIYHIVNSLSGDGTLLRRELRRNMRKRARLHRGRV